LSSLKKGQNKNEHTPQDRIRKMSHGIDSLSFIKNNIHFHNDRFNLLFSNKKPGPPG